MTEYATDQEPPSPSISPPPPSLYLAVGQRVSAAPHLHSHLHLLPSSFRAPATRVIDSTLGYTSPVLARDTHPRLSSSSSLPLHYRHIHPPPTSSRTSAHIHSHPRHDPRKEDRALRMASRWTQPTANREAGFASLPLGTTGPFRRRVPPPTPFLLALLFVDVRVRRA
ncbi:hypothetical protein C8F01DRAFT_475183 [Mycena amicta]|nr:hypothetical protein C8F01DRAFT_475183 [Mycena amicta]